MLHQRCLIPFEIKMANPNPTVICRDFPCVLCPQLAPDCQCLLVLQEGLIVLVLVADPFSVLFSGR